MCQMTTMLIKKSIVLICTLLIAGCSKYTASNEVQTRTTHEPVVTRWFEAKVEQPLDLEELEVYTAQTPDDTPRVTLGETVIEMPVDDAPPVKVNIKYHHEATNEGLTFGIDSASVEYTNTIVKKDSVATVIKEDTWGRRFGWIGLGVGGGLLLVVAIIVILVLKKGNGF